MTEAANPQILVQVKAFHSPEENIQSLKLFIESLPKTSTALYASAPFTQISSIAKTFAPNGLTVGVNEMVSASLSTFTGSIAGRMVGTSGAGFVLIPAFGANNSEEAAAIASKEKIEAALSQNVTPYVTLDESWEEHHDGHSKEAMGKRLKSTLAGFSEDALKKVIFVYNAQWILGGLWEASSSDLQSAYSRVAEVIQEVFSGKIPATRLLVSVPAYSMELSLLIAALQKRKEPFLGYLYGDLGPGTTQMQPLFSMTPPAKEEAAAPSKETQGAPEKKKRAPKAKPPAESTEEN